MMQTLNLTVGKLMDETQWKIKSFDELSKEELYDILALRSEVFVVEQECAYQDLDNKDQSSLHLMGVQQGLIVAYARLLPPGLSYETASIGRVITQGEIRGRGLGKEVVRRAIDAVSRIYNTASITISAQAHLEKFYQTFGFVTRGEPYLEDGISHINMISFSLEGSNQG